MTTPLAVTLINTPGEGPCIICGDWSDVGNMFACDAAVAGTTRPDARPVCDTCLATADPELHAALRVFDTEDTGNWNAGSLVTVQPGDDQSVWNRAAFLGVAATLARRKARWEAAQESWTAPAW